MERRRKRDEIADAAVEFGGEVGGAVLAEFPPVAITLAVVAGVGLLGFLAWKGLGQIKRGKIAR